MKQALRITVEIPVDIVYDADSPEFKTAFQDFVDAKIINNAGKIDVVKFVVLNYIKKGQDVSFPPVGIPATLRTVGDCGVHIIKEHDPSINHKILMK